MSTEGMSLDDESAQSVLVLGSDTGLPSLGLSGASDPNLLALDFTPRSTGDPDHWEERLAVRPRELVVVTTETRDADAVGADAVEQVQSPADLTGLGMMVSKHLSRWEAEGKSTPVVVFDSLTIVLQYVGLQSIFKFLHTLTTRVANVDGHGVFLLDPLTQDDRTVQTLSSLFDAVAHRADGEWAVATR